MNYITADAISKHLGERQLLEEASLLINEGDRIGLIGVNGSGKSTLLRILAQLEEPDTGDITVWGGVRIEFLEQEPALDDEKTALQTVFGSDSPQMQLRLEYDQVNVALQSDPTSKRLQQRFASVNAEIERLDAWSAESNARAILTQLGVREIECPVGELSGGQRKRVALARALVHQADVLILDEPTNHLDAETVVWLEERLHAMPGALVVVTHDRYFLDRVVNRIVELDRRQLVSYTGNYSQYLEQRAARQEQLAAMEQKRQKLLQRELEWVRRAPMARGTKQKARKQRVEELLRLRYDGGQDLVTMALAGRRLGKQVLTATELSKAYYGVPVLEPTDISLEPGGRIGILGPNGAGKSTLLDILTGKLAADTGEVRWGETVHLGYYDQLGEGLDDSMRLLEFIEEEAALIRTDSGERIEAAKMLEWFLFPRSMQRARISSLSGGERRRLYLLRTLVHQPNVLILDEPTNDLDIQTLNVLEEFLDRFTGSLIVVSHDRYFLDRTVDFLHYMEDGVLGPRYPGPYDTFMRLRSERVGRSNANGAESNGEPNGKSDAKSNAQSANEKSRDSAPVRKLKWSEQRELEALEQNIQDLQAEMERLTAEMAAAGDDFQLMIDLSEQSRAVGQRLEAAEVRWLELAELAEAT